MKHILNVIKDAFDPRDRSVAPNRAGSSVQVSLRHEVAYIKDQGQAGSCTAHAGTELMELLYRTQVSKLATHVDVNTLRFSPLFLYARERIAEGSFTQDAGADSRTIFQVLSQQGCCLEAEDAYSDRNLFVLPTAAQVSEAEAYKIGSYHRIWDVETAKTVLVSGYTFTVGMPVFSQMESDEALATGFIRVPTAGQSNIGGHEMHIIGADDSKQVFGEMGAFEVQNSWGPDWGDHGFCWIPYRYFAVERDWDFWMAHFGKPWVAKGN